MMQDVTNIRAAKILPKSAQSILIFDLKVFEWKLSWLLSAKTNTGMGNPRV